MSLFLTDPLAIFRPCYIIVLIVVCPAGRYAAVEEDCSTALALDEDYVKAYLRRGVARRHLRKLSDAVEGQSSKSVVFFHKYFSLLF